MLGSHAKCRGILKDIFSSFQLLDLGSFHQITRDADYITVCRIEGKITDSLAERAFDDVQKEVMVFMHRRIDRKNISGPGREVSVKLLAVTQMIDKLLRLLPDGDTGSRRNSHVTVDAYLRMKEEMAVCRLTVRIDMGFVERIDLIHDLITRQT